MWYFREGAISRVFERSDVLFMYKYGILFIMLFDKMIYVKVWNVYVYYFYNYRVLVCIML